MKNDLLHALSVIDAYGLTVTKQVRTYSVSLGNDEIRAVVRGNTFIPNNPSRKRTDPKVKARILRLAEAYPDWTYPRIAKKVGGVHFTTVGRIVRAG